MHSDRNVLALQRCVEADCAASYGINDRLYACSRCGALLEIVNVTLSAAPSDLRALWRERKTSLEAQDRSGVWRFRELLPFAEDAPIVSLIEGNTPLYEAPRSAQYCKLDLLKLKHQGANPTGSFKDTGMTTAVTQALVLATRLVVCASTGNTAASLAAYAARAGVLCVILVPLGQVSHAKLAQALDYGAKVLEMEGNFDACMRAMREIAEDPSVYLVNSINPFRIEGQKTVAAELAEQLSWNIPDHLVVPGGNLGNSSALGKGFRDLLAAGLIDRLPRISVVQAAGAAPFARLHIEHEQDAQGSDRHLQILNEEKPNTLASAIRIGAPLSWTKAWRVVHETGGRVLSVTEQEIADAKAIIGRDGIGCEPASATTVAGIRSMVSDRFIKNDESVVGVLTGNLLKDTDYVIKYHSNTLECSWLPEEVEDRKIEGRFRNQPITVSPAKLSEVLNRLQQEG